MHRIALILSLLLIETLSFGAPVRVLSTRESAAALAICIKVVKIKCGTLVHRLASNNASRSKFAELPRLSESNPDFLTIPLRSVPRRDLERSQQILWRVFDEFSEITRELGGPHLSQTHSFHDASIQALSLMWYQPNFQVQRHIALQVYFLHLVDDFSDSISLAAVRELKFYGRENSEAFIIHALSRSDPSRRLLQIYKQLIDHLRRDIPSVSPHGLDLLNFGIVRILHGGLVFSNPIFSKPRELEIERKKLIARLPATSPLRELVSQLPLWFVGVSIKPSLEIIEAISEINPSFEDALWGNLLFGPIVHTHNSDLESFGLRRFMTLAEIEALHWIREEFKKLSYEKRAKIVRPLRGVIESFYKVLEKRELLNTEGH